MIGRWLDGLAGQNGPVRRRTVLSGTAGPFCPAAGPFWAGPSNARGIALTGYWLCEALFFW